jgi:two-component system, OmpR family, sensor histidine kinase TctE
MEKTQASIRRKLLSWLMPLLLLLILVDSTILFRLSINKLENELDADLFTSAKDVSRFLADFGSAPKDIHLLENTGKIFLKDEVDKIIYSITDSQGHLLSGSKALQRAAASNPSRKVTSKDHYYYFTNIADERFRVVNAVFNINNVQGAQTFTIQIAGTQKWRETLTNTIFVGIVVPQLLLALLSFLIIFVGIKKGLAPLQVLQTAVSKRSEKNWWLIR